ncbi:MAG: NAD(P)H-quinone oxidoreductase subunit F [Geminocystis sp.]|nr:NAD(P)H-quinone oxidoreductase subunit F [Geminocystis sp.]HIK38513.1 NAD(P)H-quinone oxidoreductase subunit F [Geminocystis sp. M7585_C2015_104]MCS7147534.1 NAD(P)H-quinone oxidoreductase subunit F [Geminocystis sp.]MCX8077937.1 NAD(P)H-quinone oxidoreductase subunit F [Geminocystis sp.]MDW8115227.1 NAD(P)H-quinone oxidoreductase subunit F [Geminocystis sp.]
MIDFLTKHIWWIPLYGLTGAVLTLPWALGLIRETGQRPAAYINLLMTFLSFVHGSIIFLNINQTPSETLDFPWFTIADLHLSFTIEISPISSGAIELVTTISLVSQLFALGYMEKDWSLARFYGLMGFFEAALGGIAISDSLLLSYGLLEMLTLSTYLLVGFWYAQPLVVTAARDAFLTKRVGDILLLMGIVALSSYGAGLNFSQLREWAQSHPLSDFTAALVGLALIAGPTGKCAQFPLNLWLDEAMEAPNPASVMRNSIVVCAGAYILIKLQPVFTISTIASDTLIIIGTITAIGASLIALAQIDIKRALSHSTSAYLGLVFIAVGLGHTDIAFLILFSHGVAKALLFLSAGAVVYTTNSQNITEMGGLWSKMPATTLAYMTGSGGVVGLLPLGILITYSRWFDGKLEVSWWLLSILILVNFLNALNLTRVFRAVFLGDCQPKTRRAPEVPWPMALPMVSLTIITLIAPLVPLQYNLWLSPNPPILDNHSPVVFYAIPLIILSGLVGAVVGCFIPLYRGFSRPVQKGLRLLQDLLAYDFYLDRIYQITVVSLVGNISRFISWCDRYIVDGVVNLVTLFTIFGSNTLRYNTSGQSQFYLLTILIGVSLLMWWVLGGQWQNIINYWSLF